MRRLGRFAITGHLMALSFTIENFPSLPDGGPLTFTVTGKRSVDIGRDQHLDWTLPDPSRFISGKHCEVHYRDNAYWLHDVSTNGTFLNASTQRMRSPHRLGNGDRLVIGQYIIGVALDAGLSPSPDPVSAAATDSFQPASYQELWAYDHDTPPPIDPKQLRVASQAPRPVNPDFLDWAAGVPGVDGGATPRQPTGRAGQDDADMGWASGPRQDAFVPEPVAPRVAPRRPVWKDDDPTVDVAADTATRSTPFVRDSPRAAAFAEQPAEPAPVPLAASPAQAQAPAPVAPGRDDAFMRRLAISAGLPEDFFAGGDADRLAEQFGEIMNLTVASLMQLLRARNDAKRLARSTSQTTIEATENNPLKFSPSAEDAMRILFGPPRPGYLDARRAFSQSFDDLKSHQLKTYMAMQHAVTQLVGDLDPAAIASDAGEGGGLAAMLQSPKARLWDAFLIRWKATLGRDKGAPVDAFMLHFADYYDQDDNIESR